MVAGLLYRATLRLFATVRALRGDRVDGPPGGRRGDAAEVEDADRRGDAILPP